MMMIIIWKAYPMTPKQDKPISANDKEGETRAFAYWLFALWDHIFVNQISFLVILIRK
jgi:hypothetical protein